ncbi:MAG: hypothetical protein Q8M40_12285 [Legionella sp.]|nr:hypothetical protein [Legionella sp.]
MSYWDAVEVDLQALRIVRPKYNLVDVLAQCNENAPPPSDLISWEIINKGAEII